VRFDRVVAHAFGPLSGDTLEFAPGMNVIYGPNEAGKSSWHAALYAGLCGMRRARGVRKEDKDFAERYRPWGRDEWEVGAIVELKDGPHVELRHDLGGGVDRSARDVNVAGRDYSGDIIYEGAPDGSRWLGLNRRTFLHTACVRQGDILKVREDPASLQQDMQRAASTARAGATAAAALQQLEKCLWERVGSTQAPTRPLRRTERKAAEARQALENARKAHRNHVRRRQNVEGLERTARQAELKGAAMEAALADQEANAFVERLEEARALDAQFPDGAPHPMPGGGELLRGVTEALTTWNQRPAAVALTGPSARELSGSIDRAQRRLLAACAVAAEGEAHDAERRVTRALELAPLFPEGAPRISEAEEAHASQVRDALHAWDALPTPQEPEGPSVEQLELDLVDFDRRRQATSVVPKGVGSRALLIACGAVVVAGILAALLLPDLRVAGLTTAVVGAAAFLWFRSAGSRSGRADIALVLETQRDTMASALSSRRAKQLRYEAALEDRAALIERLNDLAEFDAGTASEPEMVVQRLREREADWREEKLARSRLGPKWDKLQRLLGESSLEDLVAEAQRLCTKADQLIASADELLLDELRRMLLSAADLAEEQRKAEERITAWTEERTKRLADEEKRNRHATQIANATETVRAAAARVGFTGDDPEGLAAELEAWREGQERALREAERRNESWDRLQQLLGDRTLEELAGKADRLRGHADRLVRKTEPRALDEARESERSPEQLQALRSEAESARSEADMARGGLTEREPHLPSVPDAEDALAAAKREQARVARLKDTLAQTIGFLKKAQERVLRDIAPILTHTMLDWLADVTNGRYTACRIDPESLLVEVRTSGGRWREADRLSHGTVEQVYLLLRFALCRHLTKEGERCPLILDDALAASDNARKTAVLKTLQALGKSTQVMLFTHEDDVREWARLKLRGPHDRLIELPTPPPAGG
jgi:hypothetical protein